MTISKARQILNDYTSNDSYIELILRELTVLADSSLDAYSLDMPYEKNK